jgi:hypothetical protein
MFSEYKIFSVDVHVHYKTIYACTLFTCSSKDDSVFGLWKHSSHLILDSNCLRSIIKIKISENVYDWMIWCSVYVHIHVYPSKNRYIPNRWFKKYNPILPCIDIKLKIGRSLYTFVDQVCSNCNWINTVWMNFKKKMFTCTRVYNFPCWNHDRLPLSLLSKQDFRLVCTLIRVKVGTGDWYDWDIIVIGVNMNMIFFLCRRVDEMI